MPTPPFSRSGRSTLAAVLLLAGCSGPYEAVLAGAEAWRFGEAGDLCRLVHESGADNIGIVFSRTRGRGGIRVSTENLATSGIGQVYSTTSLWIDGEHVPAEAVGLGSGYSGDGGVMFHFDPRELVASHPNGFHLNVRRSGQSVFAKDMYGAVAASREWRNCTEGNAG